MSVEVSKFTTSNKDEEIIITTSTLIGALINHPYSIYTNVVARNTFKPSFIQEFDIKCEELTINIRTLDVKEYIIKAFEVLEKEAEKEREQANSIRREFNEYKDKNTEFKKFLKFKEAEDRKFR